LIDSISVLLGDILKYFYHLTGDYAYSIILFAVAIKLSLLYFTHQQYKSMKDMQMIQPEMKKLQEKYKGDPETLNKKMLELWKIHKVNPLSGCLPLIIQMPIIYALYRTFDHFIKTVPEFANAKFLWIGCMPDDTIPLIPFLGNIPLFGSSLAKPDLPLVIIYGLSMYLSQMITVSSSPPGGMNQKSTAIIMSVFITFIMYRFQSALILYWLVFNLLSIVQQQFIMRMSGNDTGGEVKEITLENSENEDIEKPEFTTSKKKKKRKK